MLISCVITDRIVYKIILLYDTCCESCCRRRIVFLHSVKTYIVSNEDILNMVRTCVAPEVVEVKLRRIKCEIKMVNVKNTIQISRSPQRTTKGAICVVF